jgi:hypothetical protein
MSSFSKNGNSFSKNGTTSSFSNTSFSNTWLSRNILLSTAKILFFQQNKTVLLSANGLRKMSERMFEELAGFWLLIVLG